MVLEAGKAFASVHDMSTIERGRIELECELWRVQ